MKKNKITFVCTDKSILLNEELLPQPAINYTPRWYKNIKNEYPIDKERPKLSKILKPKTVKQCPSFVELFKEGYMLIAPCDYWVSIDKDKIEWRTPIQYKTFHQNGEVNYHGDNQFVDHLPTNSNIKGVFKIILPYGIFGPKGYSIKILPVPYSFNNDYHAVYGIQDLDTTYELNIQMNFTSDKKEILIQKGEPIALIIPYKREAFEINYEYLEDSKYKNKVIAQKFNLINSFNNRYYKSL